MKGKTPNFLKGIPGLLILILLVSYAIIVLFPVIWSIYSSFKTNADFLKNPLALPTQINLTNYINAFTKAKIGNYFLNSIYVTGVSLFLGTTLSVASAYVIARFENKFTVILKSVYISSIFLPIIFAIIPLFVFMHNLNLLNTSFSLIILYTVISFPFTIYLLIGFFKGIPREYEEAASIDGCSYFGILIKIMSPMVKPAIITVTIFNFIWIWNEYVIALTFITKDEKRTIPVGIARLMEVQRYATDWGALFAGLVIVMIPSIVFYIIFQNKIIEGINMGGIKG